MVTLWHFTPALTVHLWALTTLISDNLPDLRLKLRLTVTELIFSETSREDLSLPEEIS
jgi:hypothetical protein